MSGLSVTALGLVLLTASLVAMASRRLKLPYSVGLVVAGIVLVLIPTGADLPLTRDLIFSVFLPPLIFEAALQLKWDSFRRDLPLTLALAFPGVLIAAVVVAFGMHLFIGWSWIGAALFGVLIAATDPVSVIAAFKEMRVQRRLSVMVESESLLNDGAAAVGFGLLAAIADGGAMTPMAIVGSLLWTVAGGVAIGLAVAGALLILAGRTDDHLVEITLTTITAYGSLPSGGKLPHVRRAGIAYCRVACRQYRLEAGNISCWSRPCPRLLGIHRVLSKFVRFHFDRRTRSSSGDQPTGNSRNSGSGDSPCASGAIARSLFTMRFVCPDRA